MLFQECVNQHDNSSLEKLFHSKTIGFESDLLSASWFDEIVERQWQKMCPSNQHLFSLIMADARVIPAPGMFVVAIKYMTTRKIVGCDPEFGQATFVLCDFEGKLLGVHSHVSGCPG